MAKGISIHIGLNNLDQKYYQVSEETKLKGAEKDARDMYQLAQKQGFKSSLILDKAATVQNVKNAIFQASKELVSSDILFISFSGHGGQTPDIDGDEDQKESPGMESKNKNDDEFFFGKAGPKDELWCLYDGWLLDDDIYRLLSNIKDGVRVLVVSDSCNSGTVVSSFDPFNDNKPRVADINLLDGALSSGRKKMACSVLLLASSQDHLLSVDEDNGAFTKNLLAVWGNGSFKGTYHDFLKAIREKMKDVKIAKGFVQIPNFYEVGQKNSVFAAQKPFTI